MSFHDNPSLFLLVSDACAAWLRWYKKEPPPTPGRFFWFSGRAAHAWAPR